MFLHWRRNVCFEHCLQSLPRCRNVTYTTISSTPFGMTITNTSGFSQTLVALRRSKGVSRCTHSHVTVVNKSTPYIKVRFALFSILWLFASINVHPGMFPTRVERSTTTCDCDCEHERSHGGSRSCSHVSPCETVRSDRRFRMRNSFYSFTHRVCGTSGVSLLAVCDECICVCVWEGEREGWVRERRGRNFVCVRWLSTEWWSFFFVQCHLAYNLLSNDCQTVCLFNY